MRTAKYEIVSLDTVLQAIDVQKPVFADTETDGFYGSICVFQVMQAGWDAAKLVLNPEPLTLCAALSKMHTVWHNASYDITTLHKQAGYIPFKQIDDSLYLSRIHWPTKHEFSLDVVLKYLLGYCPYEAAGLDKKVLQKSKWTGSLTSDQELYAATDVYFMPELWDTIEQHRSQYFYRLDIMNLKHAFDFQRNGLPVDSQRLNDLANDCETELAKLALPINVNSYKQVREYLGIDKSDDLTLAGLIFKQGNEVANKVRKAKKLRKLLSFLKKFEVERIYGVFAPSARSGRYTCKDQNLQQLPRASKCVFGFPEDSGKVLIYADYPQLELRTIAAITNCQKMIDLFRAKEDLHGFTAAQLFGTNFTKKDRNVTKTYNFNFLYGGGVGMVLSILLSYGLVLTEAQGSRDRVRWRNLWKEIYRWQQKGIAAWKSGKIWTTPSGRPYVGKMMTDQLNLQNQGAGADVAKLALHYFMVRNQDPEVKLCNFIHDSFILESPDNPEQYKRAALLLAQCMQDAWVETSVYFEVKDIPMPIEVFVGYNWGDIEDEGKYIYDYTLEGEGYAD